MDAKNQVERVLNGLAGTPKQQLDILLNLRRGYLDLSGAGKNDETRRDLESRIKELCPTALSPVIRVERIVAGLVSRNIRN